MIFINDKKLDPEGNDRFAKEYQAAVKNIKKRGFPVIFRLNPNRIKRNKTTKGMKKEWNKQYIPYTTIIDGKNGSEKWTYTRTPPVKKDDNLVFNNNGRWVFKTLFTLDMRYIDLIFFLEYKSPMIKNGTFYIENKAKEAAEKAGKLARDAEAQYFIYSPTSPLSSFPKKLRTLASAWGIRNALEKNPDGEWMVDINIIKNELFQNVRDGEKKDDRGYEEFSKAVGAESLIKKRALTQQALDRNLVGFRSKDYTYLFLDERGNEAGRICRISPKEINNKLDALNNFLETHDYEMGMIERAIEMGDKKGEDVTIEPEQPSMTDIQKMRWNDLAEEAKKAGLKYVGLKKDDLLKSVLEYYDYA